MPSAATRLPVSEFESPKLKTAGKLKSVEVARGKKKENEKRTWNRGKRGRILVGMAVLGGSCAVVVCVITFAMGPLGLVFM